MVARAAWRDVRVMKNNRLCLIPIVLLASVLSAQPRIEVNLYDTVGLRPEIREEMKRETSKIFHQAGLVLRWVVCEVAGHPLNMAECAQPLGSARLMLQVVPGSSKKNPRAAGMAIIQPGSSHYACIYVDRVRDLAKAANWGGADLLGHAAAHELGHLLLGSSEHARAGVMRARWESDDLRRLSHNFLVFLPGQLAAVRTLEPAAN